MLLRYWVVSGCKLMILNDIYRNLWGMKRSWDQEVHGGWVMEWICTAKLAIGPWNRTQRGGDGGNVNNATLRVPTWASIFQFSGILGVLVLR